MHEEGLTRSVELRKEKWPYQAARGARIDGREEPAIAQLGIFSGNYTLYGLGDTLVDPNGVPYTGLNAISGTDATATMVNGRFQDYNLGFKFSMPIGYRAEYSVIRNQQLQLIRERNVLQDQELELSHEISDAVRNLDTQFRLMQTNFNDRVASEQEVNALNAAYEAGTVTLDVLLAAQQRRAVAEAAYYRSLIDYNRAIAQIHFVKGSLLEYNDVYLAEGPWPCKAYFDARRHAMERDAGKYINYGYTRPDTFSRGPVEQFADGMPGEQRLPSSQQPTESITAPKPKQPADGGGPNTPTAPSGQPNQPKYETLPPNGLQPGPTDSRSSGGGNYGSGTAAAARQPRVLHVDGPQLGTAPTADSDRGNDSANARRGFGAGSGGGSAASRSDDLGSLLTTRQAGATSDESNSNPPPAESGGPSLGGQR